MSENGNGSGNLTGFLMGAVVGAAVGAGVALLLAPRTGEEARKWLAKSTREIKDKAVSAFDQAKETVRREKEVARRDAMEIAGAHELHV